MNPGYLSYVLMTCFLILLISGWKSELAGDVSGRFLAFFPVIWLAAMTVEWHMTPHITINFTVFVIAIIIVVVLIMTTPGKYKIYVIFTGLFISVWYAYMAYIHRWSPFSMIHPVIDAVAGAAVATGLMLRNPMQQICAVSIGLLVGDLMEQLLFDGSEIRLGHASFQDQWWLSILLTRSISLLSEWMGKRLFRFVSRDK